MLPMASLRVKSKGVLASFVRLCNFASDWIEQR
jgi:hypothetical protein